MPRSKHGFGYLWFCLLFAASLALSSCGTAPAAFASTSGIAGVTKVGPRCPVVSATTPCPATPAAKVVAVWGQDGHEVTHFTSARNGTFRIPLPPGRYMLKDASNPDGNAAPLLPDTVQVPPDAYVQIEVLFYTGIV
jgi:hypothetical protein